jgi:hypothetical protein
MYIWSVDRLIRSFDVEVIEVTSGYIITPAPSADVIYGIEDLDLRPPFLCISRSLSSLETADLVTGSSRRSQTLYADMHELSTWPGERLRRG